MTLRAVNWVFWLSVAGLAVGSPATLSNAAEVAVVLVPQDQWTGTTTDPANSVVGTVFLYREGDFRPRLVFGTDEHHMVPGGKWTWSAEAEGYTAVSGGAFDLPEEDEAQKKTILWPALPACRVILNDSTGWKEVSRIDFVSIDSGIVVPVTPGNQQRFWVPTGRILAYSVVRGEIYGIARIPQCTQFDSIAVAPPPPPDSNSQHIVVSVVLPNDSSALHLDRDALDTKLVGARGARYPASEAIWQNKRGTLFLLDVPAAHSLALEISHPELRTEVVGLDPFGGSTRELDDIQLLLRRSVEVDIDYRPITDHATEVIEVLYCGQETVPFGQDLSRRCDPVSDPIPLEEGLKRYVIENLDDGNYVVQARIDDEYLEGLGRRFTITLEEDQPAPVPQPISLEEFEIFGQILLDGEPVEGAVVVTPVSPREAVRRFPTESDGLYHMYYFGRELRFGPVSHELEDRSTDERLGLSMVVVSACAEGYCSQANVHSGFVGGGPLDWEIENENLVTARVVNAETGEPIPDAEVHTQAPSKLLFFDHGEVKWLDPTGVEGVIQRTDLDGYARIRLPHSGRTYVAGAKYGFLTQRQVVDLEGVDGALEIEIELEPDRETGALSFRTVDGEALSNAFLLVIDDKGFDAQCSARTNSHGFVDFPSGCSDAAGVILLHPRAELTFFEGGYILRSGGEIDVASAPVNPPRLRLVDQSGSPVAGVPIELSYTTVTVRSTDLLAAATATGYLPFYLTDDHGQISLRGIDPEAIGSPDIRPAVEGHDTYTSLVGLDPGSTLEIVIDHH